MIKVNNRSLIITDPCYISFNQDWGTDFDWETSSIKNTKFTDYIWEYSGYGDGSPLVYTVPRKYNPEDFIQMLKDDEEIPYDIDDIGEFGMDSGCMGVFYLDETLKYHPDCLDSLPESCYVIIEDFTGTVKNVLDEEGYNHFILIPENESSPYIITE